MTYAPGTTYAAVILKTIRDIRGDAPLPDSDFKDWVEGKLAIPEMEPLRDWIEAEPDLFIGNLSRGNGLHDWNARYARPEDD